MCGVVGVLKFDRSERRIEESVLIAMRDTMEHRGPDGGGLWIDDQRQVGLGHRRLSIIDLAESANQPMHSQDNRFVLSYNGEIYNHKELREELTALGHTKWRTDHSDTETLLKAFEQWGLDALQRLRGMFAIALWDRRERTMTLVRDRIGIKPMYFAFSAHGVSFASEIKALLADPEQPRRMNETGLFHYFSVMTTPAPLTMFEGIEKLPGGCWLQIDAKGNRRQERYWDVWDETSSLEGESDEQIAERVRDELETAVRYRKVSDVPVGVFLSGGIDSSTNAALFSKGETQPIKTFSIGYEQDYDSYKNELHFARKMAGEINADHHELKLSQDDLFSFLPKLIHLQDEPIADPVCVPVYYVSKLARDNGVVVAQVGEGADEVYWGYPWWKRILQARKLAEAPMGNMVRKLGIKAMDLRGWSDHYLREMFRRVSQDEPFFYSGAETFTHHRKFQVLSPRMREAFAGRTSAEALADIVSRYQQGAWEKQPLNWMSYVDLNLRLPELLLMRVDKMSMGVSLECRVPFLDHKFVGLGMSIPARVKMRGGTLKHILKKAVTGLIPDELIHRKKQGFGVPVHEWFLDRLGGPMRREIDAFCDHTDVLDRGTVEQLFAYNGSVALWWLFNLALWHKHFILGEEIGVEGLTGG